MYGGTKRALNLFLLAAVGCAGLYAGLRWLLPWAAPFLVALVLARAIEPAVSFFCSQRWPRSLAAGVCTTALLLSLGLGIRLIIGGAVSELRAFSVRLPELIEGLTGAVSLLEERAMRLIDRTDGALSEYLLSALESVRNSLAEVPTMLSGKILSFLSAFAERTPSILLFTITACIGVYFISSAFPEIRAFASRQIPLRWRSRARELRNDLRNSLGHWLKAQLILSGITFVELFLALLLLRVRYALLLALVISVIDALPVLGAGTVLVPWAVVEFLIGSYPMGLGLVITYAAITLVRQCIQAKLLGDQLGLHPVASLLAVYVGFRTLGIWGMLLFPLLFVTVKQLNDRGILRLWKTEEST
jgi:sporulation integral membrane protein YtvI